MSRQNSGNPVPLASVDRLAPYMNQSLRSIKAKGLGNTLTRSMSRNKLARNNGSQRGFSFSSMNDYDGEFTYEAPKRQQSINPRSSQIARASYKQKIENDLRTSFRFANDQKSSTPLFHESGYPLATRSIFKKPVHTTSTAITLAGGEGIHYQGILAVKKGQAGGLKSTPSRNNMSSTLRRMAVKKKVAVLREGRFRIYNAPRNGSGIETGTNMLSEEDLEEYILEDEFAISNLRSIYYTRRGLKAFSLVYWVPKQEAEEGENSNFTEHTIQLTASNGEEAEHWIRLLLIELRNQALVFDNYAKILRQERKNTEAILTFLRMAVDLWALSKGKSHFKTKEAQLRLADWLITHDEEDEGQFWEDYAIREDRRTRSTPLEELQDEIDNQEIMQRMRDKMAESLI